MKGPLDSPCKMQRRACLWITSTFKTSPMGAAETLAGVPPIHLHVKKLVEQSHVCTRPLQASHAFCRLVDRDHKFSVVALKGQICGDLKSPITEAWLNLDLSSLDLDPVNRFCKGNPHFCCCYHSPTIPAPLAAGSHTRRHSRLSRSPETSTSNPYLSLLVV
jgi:hypothetical protein